VASPTCPVRICFIYYLTLNTVALYSLPRPNPATGGAGSGVRGFGASASSLRYGQVAYSEPERFFKVFLKIGGFFCPSNSFPEGALPQRGPYGSGWEKTAFSTCPNVPERDPFGRSLRDQSL